MKIKTKIILNSLIWIAVSMGASMGIVYFLMEDYAREFSVKRVGDGAGIIENELAEMKEGLASMAGRISRQVTGKLELINDPDMREMAEEGKRDLTLELHRLSRVGFLPMAVVYGQDGSWISFVRLDGDAVRLGFSTGNDQMMSARIPAGEKPPEYNQWERSERKTVFPARLEISAEHGHEYTEAQGLIRVNTWMPVITGKMDEKTMEIRRAPGGMVMVSGPVDRNFCHRMSKLVGGEVNFFLGHKLSAGTLDEYASTDPTPPQERAGKTGIGATGEYRKHRFSQGDFFEGRFPIFNKDGYLGAVAILCSQAELNRFFRQILVSFVVAGACCILLVIPFSLYFAKRIFAPAVHLGAFMKNVSKGDFTQKIDIRRNDEIGSMAAAMKEMSLRLGTIIQENISVSRNLLELISAQAPSLEETSAALEEISATSDQNSENAGQADRHIREVRQMLRETRDSMDRLSASMTAIMDAGRETAGVIKTIDAISFQTNLLALNASVEAARAGDSGAGFGVVASEVKNLAEKTAQAAQNTATLVQDSVDKMAEGAKLSAQLKNSFEETIKKSDEVSDLINSISTASNEQHRGIDQINKSMNDIEGITRQIVAAAETLSHAMDAFRFEGGNEDPKNPVSRGGSGIAK